MNFQINNILNEDGKRWRYSGTVIYRKETYSVAGTVPRLRTQGMIKRAVIEDARKQVLARAKPKRKTTIRLVPDENFVSG